MTISYPISAPTGTLGVESVQIGFASKVAVSESPFTGDEQVQVHQGQRFHMTVTLTRGLRADLAPWIATLKKLNGKQGTFLFGDPMNPQPRGQAATMPGTPLVAGGSQTGQTLNIDGAPASVAGWLLQDDWIGIGSGSSARLYSVLDDVDTNGSGEASLTLYPSIRTAWPDNQPLVLFQPKGVWRLARNLADWEISRAMIYGLSFPARSVV